ncbi:hypothetical protein [Lachnoclostridium sp. Marseille-P6806]|uniref:hypothetical protein n=1 Tax=Lachnoclostridium sp. Marseille-P6806 TaxID=2364793 RepID=UPI0013EEF472|nr:hypothetical protein [Lachnoclostridium sp. Marseille-P6806]
MDMLLRRAEGDRLYAPQKTELFVTLKEGESVRDLREEAQQRSERERLCGW